MKNHLPQVFWLILLVTVFLIGLSLFSRQVDYENFTLRRMDIFSDIRAQSALPDSTASALPGEPAITSPNDSLWAADSLAIMADSVRLDSIRRAGGTGDEYVGPPPPLVDTAYFGNVIEDYTPGQRGLSRFFASIDSIRLRGRTVRVAWYGDSFVEGDILIGDLRDTLQTVWGGGGVGFAPITSEVAQFKRTLKHSFRGWTTYSIVKKSPTHPPFGLDGHVYVPEPDAKVHYEGTDQYHFYHTSRWSQVRLFYTADYQTPMIWQNEGQTPKQENLPPTTGKVSVWKCTQPDIPAFAMRFPGPVEGLRLYGAALEDGAGFYVDNFSVRGNSGGPLRQLDPAFIQAFDHSRQYDLVVLQVGLNAVTNSLRNIGWYRAELERTFSHLRACFPGKPILIVSVGDRGGKVNGELSTMISVPAIVAMQRDLARKHGFLFYDLFHGMGGPGTMVAFSQTKPRLANTDYTHLTHDGGKVVGRMFARLFLEEQRKWRGRMRNTE